MPALNVYVTDDLKARMGKVNTNWSEVCRQAIELELLRLEGKTLSKIALSDVKDWISEHLEPTSIHKNVVVKPYLHKDDKTYNDVKVLLDFYTQLTSDLRNCYLNTLKGSFGNLLDGKHHADILFPGRDWLSGNLGIKLELYFNFPKPLEVIEAEMVVNTNDYLLAESETLNLVTDSNSKLELELSELDVISKYIGIEQDIDEYQTEEFNILDFPSEIYSVFRKAWNNLYSKQFPNPPKPPTSTVIKNLWKKWYHPKARLESENWPENWKNRRKSPDYLYEWETIVAAFYFALNGENYDPSFSEMPEDSEDFESCDGNDVFFLSFIEFVSQFVFDGVLIDFTQIKPSELSWVPINERDELPEQSGIYFVLDNLDTIHYIGMSVNLRNRWYSNRHHRQADFDLIEGGKIAYISSLPKHYLKDMEATFIKTFVPSLNIQGKPK